MKLICILPVFFIFLCSCGQKKCDISNIAKVQWQQLDSSTSYFACTASNEKLRPEDSVTISFAGTVNKDNKLVPRSELPELMFLHDLMPGTQTVAEAGENMHLRAMLGIMGRNAEYYMKIQPEPPRLAGEQLVRIYLKDGVDSAKAIEWVSSFSCTRSVSYTSKEAARRIMMGDEDIDFSAIKDMDNPLPNTLTVTIDPLYMNKRSLDSLGRIFKENKMVETVVLPNPEFVGIAGLIAEFTDATFIIKIKT